MFTTVAWPGGTAVLGGCYTSARFGLPSRSNVGWTSAVLHTTTAYIYVYVYIYIYIYIYMYVYIYTHKYIELMPALVWHDTRSWFLFPTYVHFAAYM